LEKGYRSQLTYTKNETQLKTQALCQNNFSKTAIQDTNSFFKKSNSILAIVNLNFRTPPVGVLYEGHDVIRIYQLFHEIMPKIQIMRNARKACIYHNSYHNNRLK
jgi:hypothetical protein